MPEHRRVLGREGGHRDSDDHVDGRHVHAGVQVLQHEDVQSPCSAGRERSVWASVVSVGASERGEGDRRVGSGLRGADERGPRRPGGLRREPHREDDIGAEASVEEEDHNRVSDAGLQREGGVHRGGGCERSERVRAQHRDGGAAVGGCWMRALSVAVRARPSRVVPAVVARAGGGEGAEPEVADEDVDHAGSGRDARGGECCGGA